MTVFYSLNGHSFMASRSQVAAVSALITQAREQEAAAVAQGERLGALAAEQESLIAKQREALLAASETSTKLAAVERQRSALKAQLAAQKSRLLVAAGEASTLTATLSQALEGGESRAISSGAFGSAVLEAIEKIQGVVFEVTEDALKDENLAVSPPSTSALICTVSEIIEQTLKRAGIDEDPEDTINRQSCVIQALAVPSEAE
jgi:hypothetical protein